MENNCSDDCEFITIRKKIKINKCLSLLLYIFVSLGGILGILDNDLMRDIINGEFKFKPSVPISAFSIFYNLTLFIASNVVYFSQ